MPDHYYSENPVSAHAPRTVEWVCNNRTLVCQTDAGVFSRDHIDPGSALLITALLQEPAEVFHAGRWLDLGCGWGAVGISLACHHPEVRLALCDVNRRALDLAQQNFVRNGAKAEFFLSDGLAEVPGEFIRIATNPPIRAGKAVIYRLFEESRVRLSPGGALYVVIRKQQGAPSALTYLRTLFSTAEVCARDGGYWVIRCQA